MGESGREGQAKGDPLSSLSVCSTLGVSGKCTLSLGKLRKRANGRPGDVSLSPAFFAEIDGQESLKVLDGGIRHTDGPKVEVWAGGLVVTAG